jgi:N-acetylglucosamine malate deacetylase 2
MHVNVQSLGRILVLAAHPDDEILGCGGLLQRATSSLVIFGVDGAPPHYGFENTFGSLNQYSTERFSEAARALRLLRNNSFQRLNKGEGNWFVDQHLFQEFAEAYRSLVQIAGRFAPDTLVTHSFEGGHIDHDACHVLSKRLARQCNLTVLEFPLYSKAAGGKDVLQQFRDNGEGEFTLTLSRTERQAKKRMLNEYRTQKNLLRVFHLDSERFRPVDLAPAALPPWTTYPFENKRGPLASTDFFERVLDFENKCEHKR